MYEEGEITKFVSSDLLRLYEVMDEIYDEYLENTKDLGPADNAIDDESPDSKKEVGPPTRQSKL